MLAALASTAGAHHFVDMPRVLSGEKRRTQRSYDFTGVTEWFTSKCDLILLLFDPHKLDISDEFKRVISSLHGHDDKIKVVLNKADQVDTQQLMRVYGALMWSLGKVLNTRVYIGSFNDKPLNEKLGLIGKELFEKEQIVILIDLMDIPRKACDRKVNEFVKRARAAKAHAHIISHLEKEMPAMVGKNKAQQRLMDNLEEEFAKVSESKTTASVNPVGEVQVVEAGNLVISIQVLRSATRNFSEQTVLGKGGLGTVYRGQLDDGTNIAVKRMESSSCVVSSKGRAELFRFGLG